MLKNFWYAIENSSKITTKPLGMQVLGQRLVAWRDEDGNAHVMSDLCIHRGGALSKGKVKGNCIACPYHGWEFNGHGACQKIPAQKESARGSRAATALRL